MVDISDNCIKVSEWNTPVTLTRQATLMFYWEAEVDLLKRMFHGGHQWLLYSSKWLEYSNDTYKVGHFNVLLGGRRGFVEDDVLCRKSIIIVFKQMNEILQWYLGQATFMFYREEEEDLLKRMFYGGHQGLLYSSKWMEYSSDTYKAGHFYV